MLLLIRTPLVDQSQPCLLQTVLLGPMVLRCLGHSYGPLWSFPASGASRLTEYLSLGHSNGVCLRQLTNTSYGGAFIVKVKRALQS
jgi:hypothetical protein